MGAAMVEAGIAVKALLQGATPERKQEIEDLWDRYAPKVCVVEDARGNLAARLQWVEIHRDVLSSDRSRRHHWWGP